MLYYATARPAARPFSSSLLGVIIGVCADIAMGAIGEGAKAQVVAQLSSEQAVVGLAHLNSTEVTMIAPIPA